MYVLCFAEELCAAKLKEDKALQDAEKRTKKWREKTKEIISSLPSDHDQSSNKLKPPEDLSTLEDGKCLDHGIIKFYFE